jgi:hypothetical protein
MRRKHRPIGLLRTGSLRDLALSLSVANLLCLGIWRTTLLPDNAELYFLRSAGDWSFYASGVFVFLLLGGLLFSGATLIRDRAGALGIRLARWGLVLLTSIALNAVRHDLPALSSGRLLSALGVGGIGLLFVLAASIVGWTASRWPADCWRILTHALLALFPFCLVTTTGALSAAARSLSGPSNVTLDRPRPTTLEGIPERRVVVVVFDELDQSALFDSRENGLDLPAFDRLRRRSVDAVRAYPPSNSTWNSIPALLTGVSVTGCKWEGPRELLLDVAGEPRPLRWSEQTSVFDDARQRGLNAALVGWAHPYCRIIGGALASCSWFPYVPSPGANLGESFRSHLVSVLEAVPGMARLQLRDRLRVGRAFWSTPAHHRDQYLNVHGEALRLVTDARLALVVAHYPVPHYPFIWDRTAHSFRVDGGGTYPDNLALADKALDGLLTALEHSGLGAKTTIIVTSDHWQRTTADEPGPRVGDSRHRVPFLVHLPGQTTALRVPVILRTTLLRDFVRRLLAGDVREASEALAWLSARRSPEGQTSPAVGESQVWERDRRQAWASHAGGPAAVPGPRLQ